MATQTRFTLRNSTIDSAKYSTTHQDWVETTFNNIILSCDSHFASALSGMTMNFDLCSFELYYNRIEYMIEAVTPHTKTLDSRVRCYISVVVCKDQRSVASYYIDIGGRRQQIPHSVLRATRGVHDPRNKHRFYYTDAADIIYDIDLVVKQKMRLITRNNKANINQMAKEADAKLTMELAAISVQAIISEVLDLEQLTNDTEKKYHNGSSWRRGCQCGTYITKTNTDDAVVKFTPDGSYLTYAVKMTPKSDGSCTYRISTDSRCAWENTEEQHLDSDGVWKNTPEDSAYDKRASEVYDIVSRTFDSYQDLSEEHLKQMLQRVLHAEKLAVNFIDELCAIAPYSYEK